MMELKTGYVLLRDVHFHAFHGVLPQEQQVGGDFTVTLRVGYPLAAAIGSDAVSDTLDYSALYQTVKCEMDIPSNLLEHVAGRIVTAIEDKFPQVTSIDLTLLKLNPPMGADMAGAGVELHLRNDKDE